MGTITCLFETRDDALRAVAALRMAGFSSEGIIVVDRESQEGAGRAFGAGTGGLPGSLNMKDIPEETARGYEAGVARGGTLVSVGVDPSREADARMILERDRTISPTSLDTIRTDEPLLDPVDANTTAAETEGIVGAGGATGGVVGGIVGMLAGGPIGAAVGVAVGALAGGAAGAALDYGAAEPEFHREWQEGPHRDRVSWDLAGPAYRYGWESFDRIDYRGRSWDEVRPALERDWTGGGPWGDAEPMVHSGWHRRAEVGGPMGGSFPRDAVNA